MTAPATPGRFTPGSLVRARGREWVVLPESDDALLVLRPLGGRDDEIAGIDLAFEGHDVRPATFAPPTTADLGDHASARLLHQALRLSVRDGAGPFRSFARIAVEPRPYQLVPLLMAPAPGDDPPADRRRRRHRQDRRGAAHRPRAPGPRRDRPARRPRAAAPRRAVGGRDARQVPHRPGRRPAVHGRPPRARPAPGRVALRAATRFVVVSLDFIKSDRHRLEFLRTAPEFVIVDEAHTCVEAGGAGSGRHMRAELVRRLASDAKRHMVLVTATPHSGNEAAFRDLLGYLDPWFDTLPEDLAGEPNRPARERLARHLVQRRRGDITKMLEDTPFPERLVRDETYTLTTEYGKFIDRVIAYAREVVRDPADNARRQRVRWWSALALLRSISSSPAAAAATLRERSRTAEAATSAEADAIGRRAILDQDDESLEGEDITPGADPTAAGDAPVESTAAPPARPRPRRRGARRQGGREARQGHGDREGAPRGRATRRSSSAASSPPPNTSASALRKALPKDVTVEVVTGTLAADDRKARVDALHEHPKRVLVATDCLSEGINLQDAASTRSSTTTSPGTRPATSSARAASTATASAARRSRSSPSTAPTTPIDGIVLSVLLRKHKQIQGTPRHQRAGAR